jgi:hypothetical protein
VDYEPHIQQRSCRAKGKCRHYYHKLILSGVVRMDLSKLRISGDYSEKDKMSSLSSVTNDNTKN